MRKITTGKSKIQGTGIFAAENIKIGAFVCSLTGRQIRWVYNEETDRKKCANWVGIGRNLWIDPEGPLSQLNHSCDPNMGLKGEVRFHALKDIKIGDELTFDYSTAEEATDWSMKCLCGSSNCRKTITSIQFLPQTVYLDYLPYIPTYFQKVYNRQ